jgi:hypothetical protein
MMTRLGPEQIDRDLHLLRRREAAEHLDVKTRLLRRRQGGVAVGGAEARRPVEMVRPGQHRLRGILARLRRAQRAVGLFMTCVVM